MTVSMAPSSSALVGPAADTARRGWPGTEIAPPNKLCLIERYGADIKVGRPRHPPQRQGVIVCGAQYRPGPDLTGPRYTRAMSRIAIISGYFNPLHVGHLKMIQAAAALAEQLVVIVNNDEQQLLKKGKIIIGQEDRLLIVQHLRPVDEAILAVDHDGTVRETLALIRRTHPDDELVFANGGDRKNSADVAESSVCVENDIELIFGVGGDDKHDSSSRINAEMGLEA